LTTRISPSQKSPSLTPAGFIGWQKPRGLTSVVILVLVSAVLATSLGASEDDILRRINGSSLWETCLRFEQIGIGYRGFRYSGGPGASAAADWIKTAFREAGLNATEEKFVAKTWLLDSRPTMKVVFQNGSAVDVGSFVCEFWTVGTGRKELEAPFVVLPCPDVSGPQQLQSVSVNRSEWDAVNISGCITLTGMSALMNGEWADVLVHKLSSQRPRLIIFAWWYDFLSVLRPEFNILIGNRSWGRDPAFGGVPVALVSYQDSLWLRKLGKGTRAIVKIQTHLENCEHRNVVGVLKSPRSTGQEVILCAHYDSAFTPGFMDDGTGVCSMLEIAHTLTCAIDDGSWAPDFDMLFIGFDAEEMGCVGSLNYVAMHREELGAIKAVVSLDCLGADKMVVASAVPLNETNLFHILNMSASSLGLCLKRVGYSGDHASFQNPLSLLAWSLGESPDLRNKLAEVKGVRESIGVGSSPAFQQDLWWEGEQGWIHTTYDNSTTALQKRWVTPRNLELQTRAVAMTILKIGENWVAAVVLIGLVVGRSASQVRKRVDVLTSSCSLSTPREDLSNFGDRERLSRPPKSESIVCFLMAILPFASPLSSFKTEVKGNGSTG